jgi:SH3-like domain-containing protein
MFRYISMVICLALLSVLFLNATAEAQKILSVQVREGQLRATPSHLGKIVAKTSYGDWVTVLGERGAWKKVSLSNGKYQGWMHSTALTSKKIVLKAGQANVGTSVTRDEIALAGKGFSEEVEAQYRKTNKNLDYTWINRMEAMKVSSGQIEDFITGGHLALSEQGGKP